MYGLLLFPAGVLLEHAVGESDLVERYLAETFGGDDFGRVVGDGGVYACCLDGACACADGSRGLVDALTQAEVLTFG